MRADVASYDLRRAGLTANQYNGIAFVGADGATIQALIEAFGSAGLAISVGPNGAGFIDLKAWGVRFSGAVMPGTPGQVAQNGAIYMGPGVPNNALGADGDVCFRTDTPSTANQRIYQKAAGAWVGIV